mgnify:CR=1 FL=1
MDKKNKSYFSGCYFKFVTKNNKFSFAIILSSMDGKWTKQLITKDDSYIIKDDCAIKFVDDKTLNFNIDEQGLTMKGVIKMGLYIPPKKDVMGPYRHFKMECKHKIISLYHSLSGKIVVNNKPISFDGGRGYIEGDEGYSFPSEYIWYNSIYEDATITLAIATIPFGLIKFTGLLCVIRAGDKQYNLSTYNGAKIKEYSRKGLLIKKGSYALKLDYDIPSSPSLLAPTPAGMNRKIKEGLAIKSSYVFKKGKNVILIGNDDVSSLEYMMRK